MLLTISTTHAPAEDLGYLLHKHPAKVQEFTLAFGKAHVFYPEVSLVRCTVALLIDVDPIGLVRGKGGERTLDQYVNDRPYVASSMLAVAIARVFGTALSGVCKARPELVAKPIPLEAGIASIPCEGGENFLKRLFEPMGFETTVARRSLDESFPEWGESNLYSIRLKATKSLANLLKALYVLIPVLDDEKHYWVGDDEVQKLLRHGEGWLADHPERNLITTRYLKYRRDLVEEALRQLREQDGESPGEIDADLTDPHEQAGEEQLSLHEQRHGVVLSVLTAKGARRVIDLGCGEGRLLQVLLTINSFDKIVGLEVSHRALKAAADRLRLDRLPPIVRKRIDLYHGSLVYRDKRLEGFDAAVLCEVIEHMDVPRLETLERVVFGSARSPLVIVTTPNSEYNILWKALPSDSMRHRDHRFEWTRIQFREWADQICARFGYACEFRDVGPGGIGTDGSDIGAPTQMGVFSRLG